MFLFNRGAFNGLAWGVEGPVVIKRSRSPNIKKEQIEGFKRVMRSLEMPGYVVSKVDGPYMYKRQGVFVLNREVLSMVLEGSPVPIKFKRLYLKLNPAKLREERAKRGISLGQLARITGISKETLYRYEQGLTMATPKNAEKLVKEFGESILQQEVEEETEVEPKRDELCKEVEEVGGKAEVIGEPVDVVGRVGEMRFAVVYGEIKTRHRQLRSFHIEVFSKPTLRHILKKEDQEY